MTPFCDKHQRHFENGRCSACDAAAAALSLKLNQLCDQLAFEFFEASGDVCAVSNDLRGVIERRLAHVQRFGKVAA